MKKTMLPVTACAILMLMSCKHRELCYDHTHMLDVEMRYDWTLAPDAAPASMVTMLFPVNGDDPNPRRHEIVDRNGAVLRIMAGQYMAVGFNGTTETLVESGNTYDSFLITTPDDELLSPMSKAPTSAPRPGEAEDEPVRKAPDVLWSGFNESVSLVPLKANQHIDIAMHESTITCTIELRNVDNTDAPIEISGALSGVSGAFSPSAAKPTAECVTVPVPLKVTDPHTITGTITLFGHCPGEKNRHIFTIYTSNRCYYHFDVTDRMHSTDHPDDIRIVIDEALRLPDPEGTGMSPTINGWSDEINIDLDMQ